MNFCAASSVQNLDAPLSMLIKSRGSAGPEQLAKVARRTPTGSLSTGDSKTNEMESVFAQVNAIALAISD